MPVPEGVQKQYPDARVLRDVVEDRWEVLVTRPTLEQYRAWRKFTFEDRASDGIEDLLKKCTVYPDRSALLAIMNTYPGFVDSTASDFSEMVGLSARAVDIEEVPELKPLADKYPEIRVFRGTAGWGPIAIRRPSRDEYKLWRSNLKHPKLQAEANSILVGQILIHPTREVYDAALHQFAGIPEACLPAIRELVGLTGSIDGKS
jgi:hypothetical protein